MNLSVQIICVRMPGQQSSAWTKNITEVFQKLYIQGVS